MVPVAKCPTLADPLGGSRRNPQSAATLIQQSARFVLAIDPSLNHGINQGENAMNKDQAAGSWKELKGKLKQQWGKLTDDDFTVLEGSADELSGRIQKRYGIAKEEAEKQVDTFRKGNRDLISNW
jgi:uncharacterized protein YjbJ (UPF0337 family)